MVEKSLEKKLSELKSFQVEPLSDDEIAQLEANVDKCMQNLGRLDQQKLQLQDILISAEQAHAEAKAYLETVKIFLKMNVERQRTYKLIIERA